MNTTVPRSWKGRAAKGAASVGTVVALGALGASAASSTAATVPASTRAAHGGGVCASGYSNPNFLTKYGSKQQLIAGTTDGVVTEPVFSRDSRANRRLAFTSTATHLAGTVQAGTRNVYVTSRTGSIAANGNAWQAGATTLISQGSGGPANGDSFGASLSGYTGAGDAAKSPRLIAFLSKATNLPGGNSTGTSAYVANAGGGGIRRLNVPGTATGVGISGDSKLEYVSTSTGLYLVKGSKAKKLVSGATDSPSTTLNGKQAAYAQKGTIYTITATGKRKKITTGSNPQADGGDPNGGSHQGYVRAISFVRGGGAWRAETESKVRVLRFGTTGSNADVNGGGNAVAFGNGANACIEVHLLDSTQRRGGYDIPQGACPADKGKVTDVGVSTRYNYLSFACSGGGLYVFYVGGK